MATLGLTLAGIALVALLFASWSDPGLSEGAVGNKGKDPVRDIVAAEAPAPAVRNHVVGPVMEVRTVDEHGAPLADAEVRLPGGEEFRTDATGVASLRIAPGTVLRVEKSGFLGVDVTAGEASPQQVVLCRRRTLTVHVLDEFRRPVPEVEVFAPDWWYPSREALLESGAPVGASDAEGVATLALIRPGKYFLHAYHPHWVTNSSACRETEVVEVTGDCTTTLVMAPLQVVAFRPKGVQVLKSDLTFRGPFKAGPSNQLYRTVIAAAKRDIEHRYPGCTAFVLARTRLAPPTGDERVECNLRIVPVGRAAVRLRVEMVNLADFTGPFEFTCEDSPATNAFGSVMVEGNSLAGEELKDWRILFAMTRDANPADPAMRGYEQRVRFGELATVPEGRYRLHVPDNALLDMVARQQGEIVVERGGMTTVSLNHGAPLFPVELSIAMPEGERCRDSEIHYSSVSIPGTCTEVITSPQARLRRWLPEGSYLWRILMAGPTNESTFVGSGEFVVTSQGGMVSLPVMLQKG